MGRLGLGVFHSGYRVYSEQMREAFALAHNVDYNFFINHHRILGLAPSPSQTGLYPGNEALQSVLQPIPPQALVPAKVHALVAGHDDLFEMVSFATPQPTQWISGNAGAWAYDPLPVELTRGTRPAPGAVNEKIVSTSEYGFMTIERGNDGAWRIDARDRGGHPWTHCALRGAKTRCVPEALP